MALDSQSETTAPAPTPGAGGAVDAQKSQLNQMVMQMLQKATQPKMGMPAPQPRFSEQSMTPQGYNMKSASSKSEDMGIALQNMGSMVHNFVAEHKQNQVRDAMADWQGFDNAIQKAQMVAGDPNAPDFQKKMNDALAQMPWVKSMLDPANQKNVKRLKNMYKALNVDLLDDKENVYGQALKQMHKVKAAEKKIKDVGQQAEMAKKRQQTMQARFQQLTQMAQAQAADPKNMESAAKIIESQIAHEDNAAQRRENAEDRRQAHEDNREFREQAHLDTLDHQKDQLEQQRQSLEERVRNDNAVLTERSDAHKENMALHRELIQIAADKAHTLGDTSGLRKQVEAGFPIDKLDAKDRVAVLKDFSATGDRAPLPISTAEQTVLDEGLNQQMKIDAWKAQLDTTRDANGKLSNKPMGTFWDSMKYKLGYATPNSAMVSDFSRERWSAIAGLVKGVRRGDILKSMVAHTPDPWKDSVELMNVKLDALKANYGLARATALKDHGFKYDPVTNNDLDSDIKSYEVHLNAADADVQKVEKQKQPAANKVHGKDEIPD